MKCCAANASSHYSLRSRKNIDDFTESFAPPMNEHRKCQRHSSVYSGQSALSSRSTTYTRFLIYLLKYRPFSRFDNIVMITHCLQKKVPFRCHILRIFWITTLNTEPFFNSSPIHWHHKQILTYMGLI